MSKDVAPRTNARCRGWLVLLPTALIMTTAMLFSGVDHPATATARGLPDNVQFHEASPPCQSCHPEQYAAWEGSPHARATQGADFQAQLAGSSDQRECLACHTTGFNRESGDFLGEGVTCEACHGPYLTGHPAAETMQKPMDSETCRLCHRSTCSEWESSSHAAHGVDCFDCHQGHDQGLRTGSEATLCASCHSERQTQFAHATHGISGLNCATCHMSDESAIGSPMPELQVRNHGFQVASDVCSGCHKPTIHAEN